MNKWPIIAWLFALGVAVLVLLLTESAGTGSLVAVIAIASTVLALVIAKARDQDAGRRMTRCTWSALLMIVVGLAVGFAAFIALRAYCLGEAIMSGGAQCGTPLQVQIAIVGGVALALTGLVKFRRCLSERSGSQGTESATRQER